jgi:aminoglycoside 2''-phosphotransferase
VSTDLSAAIEAIESATDLRVHSCKPLDGLSGTLVVEINHEWVFRFPTSQFSAEETQKRLKFLRWFAKRSPLAVPDPVYSTDHFVGYKRIAGDPFLPGDPFDSTEMDRLSKEDKQRIAKQLGVFLAVLHHSPDQGIDVEAGYFAGRRERCQPSDANAFIEYLHASEYRKLAAKLEAIENNPSNFVQPTIIHGDLYFRNILWDKRSRMITGIIDWDGLALGIPALDFTGLADFTASRNDDFLMDILRWYGSDNGMFTQVKENAIIEVMNWFWFYEHTNDPRGMAATIKRLKIALNA